MRLHGVGFRQVPVFPFEAPVFWQIGLPLRDVSERARRVGVVVRDMARADLAVIAAMAVAHFAWIFAPDALRREGVHTPTTDV